MRPPLPAGTILQTRYRLLRVLGQGGFGRTYLAEDQGRFSELCAIKELIPPQSDPYALAKSKELFQREAQILYQIQHPQIPQFRANFEQDQRLFLVQDYVEGQSYRKLLDQRKVEGLTFNEAEVVQLLQRILPVLAHIHAKGIIHRDIAPDNIMLREQDNLPVLIDFGVVKELANQFQTGMIHPETWQQGDMVAQHTTVGKLGYAPSEQIQTGRAYPCSDLYSLAVTVVVLLTGREPQDLFDDNTLTWYWQRWTTVSPGLAQLLNRMLSVRPGDRYQSVSEVAQALQNIYIMPVSSSPPATGSLPAISLSSTSPSPSSSSTTHSRTLAIGHAPELPTPHSSYSSGGPSIPRPRSSVWDDPLAVTLVGLGLVALTGIGSWAIVRAVLNPAPQPTPTQPVVVSPTPQPSPSPTTSPKPSPSPSPSPTTISQRLRLKSGESAIESGQLVARQRAIYLIRGRQGQEMSATLLTEGTLLTVRGPSQETLANRVQSWRDTLPYTGEYTIEISPVQGVEQSRYDVELTLSNLTQPEPSPSPTESPVEPAEPTIDTQAVNFPPGTSVTTLSDRAGPSVIKRYLVRAEVGETLRARVLEGQAALTISDPSGRPLPNMTEVRSWEEEVSRSGEYQIDVVARRETDYTLEIGLRTGTPR